MSADIVLIADCIVRSVPLILTGLAVAFAFRGGVFNLGAEGQFLVGAAAGTTVSVKFTGLPAFATLILALTAGMLAGAFWAAIAAELRKRFHVLEIISTIMLNFIALYLVSYLVRGPLQEPTHIYPQTESLAAAVRLPILLPGTRLHAGIGIAVGLAIILYWIFRDTAIGFRIKASGAGPGATKSAGMVDVTRITWNVFLCSGAIAGLAGAVEISGVTFALYENISPGYGYTAIAVALIAGLNPLAIIASGLFFGTLETGASALQRDFGIPSSIASMTEALLILVMLTTTSFRSRWARVGEEER